MAHKHCPECGGRPLARYRHKGEEFDLCRGCGGLWFDKATIERLIVHYDKERSEYDYVAHLGPERGKAAKHCPDCRKRLTRHALLADFHLEIDMCPECEGAWVESHEVGRVVKSSEIGRALERINKKLGWKEWLVQLLTGGFPVEFNVAPRRIPWMTIGLIVINCLVFALYGFGPDERARQVYDAFGLTPARVLAGDGLWTFVTAMFVHGGVAHLVGNMYFFWIVGNNVEDAVGPRRYLMLLLYCGVITGLLGALFKLITPLPADIPSIGFSGAVAAVFGIYMVWFPRARLTWWLIPAKWPVSRFLVLWLVLETVRLFLVGGAVDHSTHIAGFLTGLSAGFLLRPRVWRENPLLRYLAGPEARTR